jgi:ATP-dependent Clp protease ATP-binding subunit ClpA
LLLGVLDKGTLRLGDSTQVNFEKTIIFLTSNLGAREMSRELRPGFGFESVAPLHNVQSSEKRERIGKTAVRKNFSPEFINRIDSIVTYQSLDRAALETILDQQIADFEDHIQLRLGEQAFHLEVPARSRKFLLEIGTSPEYGARELKRVLHSQLMQPLALMLVSGEIQPGAGIRAILAPGKTKLILRKIHDRELITAC